MLQKFGKCRQIIYANGNCGFSLLDNIFGVYLVFFFLPPKESGLTELISNNPFFLGLTVMGVVIIFGRIIDSIADPIIANWSDTSKAKMGRRKFFLITGSFPFALLAALLFFPPFKTISNGNALYVAIILGLYFFFYTYFMTPYLALIPELSHTHKDRINIVVYQAVFALIGAGVVMMGVPQLWHIFQGMDLFSNKSALQVALASAAFIGFISMFISGLVIDEKKYTKSEPADVKLFESIKMTLKNRIFLIYLFPTILYWFSFVMIRTIIAYYPIVLLEKDAGFQTLLMAALFGTAAICFIVISLLSSMISNKAFMLFGLLSFAILMSLGYFIDLFGQYRVTAGLIHMALLGIPVAILLIIPNAIVSDISEVDGYRSGKKREAMFFGTQGLFMKINYGIAAAIVTYLFAVFGKDVANPLGVKLAGPVASLFCLVGFLIFLMYPQKEVVEELEKIRAEQAQSES
ncbi:MAG: MFS transporter [Deltaproteobacteria bacterium]|nr:MFS transporter [Deltaproteobacteria bacterium]